MPDEESRDKPAPDEASESISPKGSNPSRCSQTKEESSSDIVLVLKADDRVRVEIVALD